MHVFNFHNHKRTLEHACTHRETYTLFISLACDSLQSQAIQGVITVILIIYKEESEIPRHALCEERKKRRKKESGRPISEQFPTAISIKPLNASSLPN